MEAAVHVAAAVMRQKVIAASGDRMAVMFFNTVSWVCVENSVADRQL